VPTRDSAGWLPDYVQIFPNRPKRNTFETTIRKNQGLSVRQKLKNKTEEKVETLVDAKPA
jgi:hypothetical protein